MKYERQRRWLKSNLTLAVFFLATLTSFITADAQEATIIFPKPQELEVTVGAFAVDESVSIVIPEHPSEQDQFLAGSLVRDLSNKHGLGLKIEMRPEIPTDKKVIVMGSMTNPLVKKYCADMGVSMTEKSPGNEGYILQVSPELVIIAGWDDAGAFYGMQSLRQLVQAGAGKTVQCMKVRDWPELPFRGIRLYVPGPDNIPFFKRFIQDFMALYKYNKAIIEFNGMRLDRHPEVNEGWLEFVKYMNYTRSNRTHGIRGEQKDSPHFDAGDGYIIEKRDVRDMVDLAKENFIEVIPEIPSLTHTYYLLTKHPELAEYPGDRWPDTYCPSNPGSYKLLFDVYNEYIDVIKPNMIHIGHDEWWGAPLGSCPLCKGKDYSTLYAQDVTKIHDYLAARGIKIALWGDYLLESVRGQGPRERTSTTGVKYKTPGGLRPSVLRDSIPRDILVFNWFWGHEGPEMELQKLGFRQIYGNMEPNVANFDERRKKIDLMGGAPSSWANTDEMNFGKDLLSDFLGCANLLWSPHGVAPLELQKIVASLVPSIRQDLHARRVPSEDGDAIAPVDISDHLNFSRKGRDFGIDLTAMKSGDVRLGPKTFRLPDAVKGSGNCVVAVSAVGEGENPFPNSTTPIKIDEDVSSLIFLQACALPAENQKGYFDIVSNFETSDLLGWYEVEYEDGFMEIVPIQYGVNILEWNPGGEKSLNKRAGYTGSPQKSYCYEADPVICSVDPKDKPITFFAFEWVNPRFGKKIKEVSLHGTVHYQTLNLDSDGEATATKPMAANAILLAGISRVRKREPVHPIGAPDAVKSK